MALHRVAIRYAGDAKDARQIEGKLWFAVEGQAILTRQLHYTHGLDLQAESVAPDQTITASIHIVRGPSAVGVGPLDGDPQTIPSPKHINLLVRAAQANPNSAPATALPPGIHLLCHAESPSGHDVQAQSAAGTAGKGPTSAFEISAWSALWNDLTTGTGGADDADRLTLQRLCMELLDGAASSLNGDAISSVVHGVPSKGWALVPCAPSSNLICLLARSGRAGEGGKVAWLHLKSDAAEEAAEALTDSLLLASDSKLDPTYASVSVRVSGRGEMEVVAEAHRILSEGVLSGYELNPARPSSRSDPEMDSSDTGVDDVSFVDDATVAADVGSDWKGTISTEELPGGGLHRHVRVKIEATCAGHSCGWDSGKRDPQDRMDREWCEVLLAQHVPQGAYIDVDEVKARHNFDVSSSLPTRGRVSVETHAGAPIDVELPSSVSGQHLVNFNLRVDMSELHQRGAKESSIQVGMTLPVHLRYPDPACDRRGEPCEEYAWVEVPPPLASIRCGSNGAMGSFYPVLPFMPPIGVALRVPRGIAWHRDLVVWGTLGAALLGCVYTMYTLFAVMPTVSSRNHDRKHRPRSHVD